MTASRKGKPRLRGVDPRSLLLVVAVLIVIPSQPSIASASSHRDQLPATSAAFTVSGSDGYLLNVRSERGTVTIVAARGRPPVATIAANGSMRPANTGTVAASTYYAFGSPADPHKINVRLGRLGMISVSFKPSRKVRESRLDSSDGPQTCAGASKMVRRLGTFTGRIRFRGENGYTTVDVGRAKGSVGTSPFGNCAAEEPHTPGGSAKRFALTNGVSLRALNYENGAEFEAATTNKGVAFDARLAEPLGVNLIVSRTARAFAPPSSFPFQGALGSARVNPPAPFSGAASYGPSATSVRPAWSGALKVAFPGATVPLTGPRFAAKLLADS